MPPFIHFGSRAIAAEEGETLLAVLLRNGLPFPHSCQQGNCGTCRCELVSGDVLELPHSEFALSEAERARGVILACRTQVWGDCEIRALDEEEFDVHPSRMLHCRVSGLADFTHDIKEVRLAIEAGGPFEFSAGQYVQLRFGHLGPRDYSMANRPDEAELVFHIRRVPGGVSSAYVFERLRLGEVVTAVGPLGTAHLRRRSGAPILAIAGGSGLAPIRSIVATALHEGMEQPIHLYVGVRAERDVYLEDELRRLAARHANLRVQYVLSDAASGGRRRRGLVHEAVAADFASLAGWKAYLAGPPPMVEAATRLLQERGVGRADIHADAFYTSADRPQAVTA
ncbi:MAG: 2Fe-2S iron-sulfur cluster-binding protein [Pseudomonadota bacterium]|jgi:CDP-4-dehydro-6-deoxyglucose reductase/ferredoxin-NAD(P)+ reductase (naphthalene dioxygenase ferredoxin-specific)